MFEVFFVKKIGVSVKNVKMTNKFSSVLGGRRKKSVGLHLK